MVSSSNLPRHGDAIIQQTADNFGGNKFIASRQFQQFLDEIGRLVNASNQEPLDLSDIIQLIVSNESTIKSNISNLLNKINAINIDDIYTNEAKISQIVAVNNRFKNQIFDNEQLINSQSSLMDEKNAQLIMIKKQVFDNEQLISVQNSLIEQQSVQLIKINERLNNLEQLVNVN